MNNHVLRMISLGLLTLLLLALIVALSLAYPLLFAGLFIFAAWYLIGHNVGYDKGYTDACKKWSELFEKEITIRNNERSIEND